MNLEQKVWKFKDDTDVLDVNELLIVLNGRIFKINENPMTANDLFQSPAMHQNMIVGYSPLQELELNEEEGMLTQETNKIHFATKEGTPVLIESVKNKLFQWNDKEATEEQIKAYNKLLNQRESVKQGNPMVQKLLDAGYKMYENGLYTFFYLEGSEPYLFYETPEKMIILDITTVYANEDQHKYKIQNADNHLIYDLGSGAITVK